MYPVVTHFDFEGIKFFHKLKSLHNLNRIYFFPLEE